MRFPFIFLLVLSFGFNLSCTDISDRILYVSSAAGNSDIYVMASDGTNVVQLTSSEAEEYSPVWVTDSSISYIRQDGDSFTLHILDLLTLEETQVEQPAACTLDDKNMLYYNPQKAVFVCDGVIYLKQDGVTKAITNKSLGQFLYPSWSPDGTQLVVTNNSSGSNNIYLLDLNGQYLSPLTIYNANTERGELSPDGKYLVFSSNKDDTDDQDLYLMNMENKEVVNISDSTGLELIGRFSRDSSRVYYGSNKDGNWELYSYNILTKEQLRLTDNPAFDGDPRVFKYYPK